jgi:hypothetical protein
VRNAVANLEQRRYAKESTSGHFQLAARLWNNPKKSGNARVVAYATLKDGSLNGVVITSS